MKFSKSLNVWIKFECDDENGITIGLAKETEEELAKFLAILFSKCLEKSYVPKNWNIAVMMVLYRKVEEEKH